MPNTILLKWTETDPDLYDILQYNEDVQLSGDEKGNIVVTLEVPLLEDFSLNIKSNYRDASSIFGGGNLLGTIFKLQNLGGTVSDLQNMFDMQVWSKTEPIKIDFKMLFYVKGNPLADVLAPVMALSNLTVLEKYKKGSYRTPGVHLGNLKDARAAMEKVAKANKNNSEPTDEQQTSVASAKKNISITRNKFLDIEIPYVIKLGACILETAKPTFSKQKTNSGFLGPPPGPLWAELEMSIMTVFPANNEILLSKYKEMIKG